MVRIWVYIPFYENTGDSIETMSLILGIAQMIILISSISPTDRVLKEVFTAAGARRHIRRIHKLMHRMLENYQLQ